MSISVVYRSDQICGRLSFDRVCGDRATMPMPGDLAIIMTYGTSPLGEWDVVGKNMFARVLTRSDFHPRRVSLKWRLKAISMSAVGNNALMVYRSPRKRRSFRRVGWKPASEVIRETSNQSVATRFAK